MPGKKRHDPPVTLYPFKPEQCKPDAVWLILGPRNSGKSVFLFDILSKIASKYDFAILMTRTMATVEKFEGVLPKHFIWFHGYDYDCGDRFLELCRNLRNKGKKRLALMILDDCM